jgi:hypothetical protein
MTMLTCNTCGNVWDGFKIPLCPKCLAAQWAAKPGLVRTKHDSLYYYRPWKTLLVRAVADGGRSYYFRGDHRQTIPTLWHVLVSGSSETARPGHPGSG